jgi:type I restriction enzyme S subunit
MHLGGLAMRLIKQKLGNYIEKVENRNTALKYGINDVRGISNSKQIQQTKADISERNFEKFQIVGNKNFVFNRRTTRMGEKIGLGFNNTGEEFIVTEDYVVFKVSDIEVILPEYLFVFFNRPEFDRYSRWDSWGSATEFFNWGEMCDVSITIPPLPIQQKYVDVYNAMLANQQCYERGLEDLKLVCDAYIDKLKNSKTRVPIRKYVDLIDNKNLLNLPYKFKGLSMENFFIDSIADANGLDFTKYKIVSPDEYAAVLMKVGRDGRLTIARNTSDEYYLISPAYYTFKIRNINPEYFMANVNRSEFERRGWFSCDTSARGSLSWDEFMELTIPEAIEEEQQIVSELYEAQTTRFWINEKLKSQIKDICPILIKGSIEEAKKLKEA